MSQSMLVDWEQNTAASLSIGNILTYPSIYSSIPWHLKGKLRPES